jgi:small conductance mechanosensitive channel
MEITLPDNLLVIVLGIALRIGAAVLVVLVGRWLARRSRLWLAHALDRLTLTPSMETLFLTVSYYAVWILTIMTALVVLGVPVTTVLAVIGIVLVVLGVALQQSLRDLAASVNFLLFKPFVVGDLIETRGVTGTVEEIQLFTTTVVRWDNRVVILPNAEIQQAGITNFTKKQVLRTDLVFGIGYSDDIATARRLIEELVLADPRVLAEPPLQILVTELGDNSVNLGVRAAVAPADYWAVQNDLREQVKLRFDQAGITIPFPQRTVHVVQTPAPPTFDASGEWNSPAETEKAPQGLAEALPSR